MSGPLFIAREHSGMCPACAERSDRLRDMLKRLVAEIRKPDPFMRDEVDDLADEALAMLGEP